MDTTNANTNAATDFDEVYMWPIDAEWDWCVIFVNKSNILLVNIW